MASQKSPNCPDCSGPMTRCEEGHLHGRELGLVMFPGRTYEDTFKPLRGEKDPHWYCENPAHSALELFDDGEVMRI